MDPPARLLTCAKAALFAGALLLAGCEKGLFAYVNRGLPPPEASMVFARDLAVDVYRPSPEPPRPRPLLVFFYGGSWQRGNRGQYRFVGHRLARNGIVALVPDYRTYPRARFPAFMDDAAAAVAWARLHARELGSDPDCVFVAGHSAGAQIAALLATDPRYLARESLAPTQLAGVIGLSGPYDFVIAGDLAPVFGPRAQWPLAQPIAFVDGNEPPFLLIHGLRDEVVESRDSRLMAGRLRTHGVKATLLELSGGTHSVALAGLYDPMRAPSVLSAILAFVRCPGAGLKQAGS